MITKLTIVSLIVRDQEEALRFYTEKLGFQKHTDVMFGEGMRWLTIVPPEQKEVEISLITPQVEMLGEETAKEYARQIGHAPTWSYTVDDCRKTYETLLKRGVKFSSPPTEHFYGVEAVCEDLYGNTISLVELKQE